MSELQPDMLALVIGFKNFPDNLGKTVTTVRYAKTGDAGYGMAIYTGEGAWMVKGDGLALNSGGKKVICDYAFIKPKHLLPIPPLADPLDVTRKEELHA